MGALLAGIGVKDYVYAALIVVLLVGFGVYTHHERVIGADEALAPVAVLAQKAQLQTAVGSAVAAATEKDNANAYTAARAAPAPAALGLVCHNAGSSEVPETVGVVATRIGVQPTVGGSGPSFDPSGPALQRAREADAQIVYLQGRVRELETQMESSP